MYGNNFSNELYLSLIGTIWFIRSDNGMTPVFLHFLILLRSMIASLSEG